MRGASVALVYAMKNHFSGTNRKFLFWFSIVLVALLFVYSLLFHFFMSLEDRSYSWVTGVYWTLVVMSTQGFGDIVFENDAGKVFTIIVNLTGILFMLVMLPFVVIEFIYNPIMAAQKEAAAPRTLPDNIKGHVLITNFDATTEAFVARLKQHGIEYAVIVEDVSDAYRLRDMGIQVLVGNLRQPETYTAAHIDTAALVAVTSNSDPINTNIVFVARQVNQTIPIVSFANHVDSIDILELAGSNEVLNISDLMGRSLARSMSNDGVAAHIMGKIEDLRIVEARVSGTELVGKTLKEADLGRKLNLTVVGVWERGHFELAGPHTKITENSILVMAVSDEQLQAYNSQFSADYEEGSGVIILGAGRVGLAAARYLQAKGTPFTILDKKEPEGREWLEFAQNTVFGDAADLNFLKSTLFFEASAILITTNDDDINIYLCLYFRKLRPGVQIIVRANDERNVSMLHRAGADFVLSTSTMASSMLFNNLKQGHLYTMVEGLYAIQVKIPPKMVGKSLVNLRFRALTGCSVIAMIIDGKCVINHSPYEPMPANAEIIMVLTPEAEEKFVRHFCGKEEPDEAMKKSFWGRNSKKAISDGKSDEKKSESDVKDSGETPKLTTESADNLKTAEKSSDNEKSGNEKEDAEKTSSSEA
ncbi:MAG: potassium channel protein [Proteobacteria bacterium]|nr:potassium channel protein [Pseudomonadota bacterium]